MRHPSAPLLSALVAAALTGAVAAQNCAQTSIGAVPLDDPAGGSYQGQPLGVWPGGGNAPPAAHRAAGLAQAALVQPLATNGAPAADGRIVLLSIGMSNTTQEWSAFQPISDADPDRSTAVTVVDGAQGGQHALIAADPTSPYWTTVLGRLAAAGVTAQQVQAVWLKEAVPGPTGGFPAHALQLRDLLGQIARNLKTFFPNVRLCFVSSRIYAGYAASTLNPEPYAYESGFAVRWIVEQQIQGIGNLNFDPAQGPVVAPWLGWGPYTWADGLTARTSDGLVWQCQDFQADGTHPSLLGRAKVAAMLDAFFSANEFAVGWYHGNGSSGPGVATYGAGCAGSIGVPQFAADGVPRLGNTAFRIGARSAAPSRLALLVLGTAPSAIPIAGSCSLLVDPASTLPGALLVTDAQGRAIVPLPIPNDPLLDGLRLFAQWGIDDPQGTPFGAFAGLATTPGGRLVLAP